MPAPAEQGQGTPPGGSPPASRRGNRRRDNGRQSGRERTEARDALVTQLVHQYGSSERALRELAWRNVEMQQDNLKLRRFRRMTRGDATVEDVQAIVPEGMLVLSPEQARDWTAYVALGKPGEIKTKVEEHGTLATKVKEVEDKERWTTAATAVGYKPTVLMDLAKPRGLQVEMRDVVVQKPNSTETEKKPVPHVRAKETDPWMALTEYAEQQLKDHLPSLRAEAAPDGGQQNSPVGGLPWSPQPPANTGHRGATGQPKDVATRVLGSAYDLPDNLKPPAAATK